MGQRIVLPCAKGVEQVLEVEARTLGLENARIRPAAVSGEGDLETVYRLCLWSRVASRVLLVLEVGKIDDPQALYDLAYGVAWDEHIDPDGTFAVRFRGIGQGIRNTQFGALKVKDAIVDRLREKYKRRPSVDAKAADVSVDVHLHRGRITLSLDLSGGALHERGYRHAQGAAAIKETLAATLLYRCGWPAMAADCPSLIDPMCGSATLLLEALLMAADIAPGLLRERWGFLAWQRHVPALWRALCGEAQERKAAGLGRLHLAAYGYDADRKILCAAEENARRLGLHQALHLETQPLVDFRYRSMYGDCGWIFCNPPYGKRLGSFSELLPLYTHLGESFKTFPRQWRMGIIASDPALIERLDLRYSRRYKAFNGPLEVQIIHYARSQQLESEREVVHEPKVALGAQAQMFANRLEKNLAKLRRWAEEVATDAYRVYDRDMPEYAIALDLYGDHAVVQEYAPPATVDEKKARRRFDDVVQAVPEVLGIAPEKMVLKKRVRQSGKKQYGVLADKEEFLIVHEGAARFLVNLNNYLDTGLFLDHRPMRRRLAMEAADKRVLNLFSYTGTASVQAALGGASFTTSVDLSKTYLDWAQRNFDLNGLSKRHRLQHADVMAWLCAGESQFDLIFCDPPTFSNTKKKHRVFELQRDQEALIDNAMKRLVSRGTLYFSNNYRRFTLDAALVRKYRVEEISAQTLDPDFARRPRVHRVWRICHHG